MSESGVRASSPARLTDRAEPFPIFMGTDIEFSNVIVGRANAGDTGPEAACRLLAEVGGRPAAGGSRPVRYAPGQETGVAASFESGRVFLSNGGSAYCDLGHFEINTPETVAHFAPVQKAMYGLSRNALAAARERLPDNEDLLLAANHSDAADDGSCSWGGHLSLRLNETAYLAITGRTPEVWTQAAWASFLAASVVWSGQGKAGTDNREHPEVSFELSARANFFDDAGLLTGIHTTAPRGAVTRAMINTRDEPLAMGRDFARLHTICLDTPMNDVAIRLRHLTQIFAAMLITGAALPPDLFLRNPVAAWKHFSKDVSLAAAHPVLSGETRSAMELNLSLYDAMERFVRRGDAGGFLPQPLAESVLDDYALVLDLLLKWDPDEPDASDVTRYLDWPLHYAVLIQAAAESGLSLASPEIRLLGQQMYAFGPEGIFFAIQPDLAAAVNDTETEQYMTAPPPDSRAYTRGWLVDRIPAKAVQSISWEAIRLRGKAKSGSSHTFVLPMGDPGRLTRAEAGPVLQSADSIEKKLLRLGLRKEQAAYLPPAQPMAVYAHTNPIPAPAVSAAGVMTPQ